MKHLSRMTWLLWVAVLAAFFVGGWVYVDTLRANSRATIEQTLLGIARLKVQSIQNWRSDRLRDAEMLSMNPSLRSAIRQLTEKDGIFKSGGYDRLIKVVHEQIMPMQLAYEYKDIRILDSKKHDLVALVTHREPEKVDALAEVISRAWRERRPALGLMHLDEDTLPVMNLVVPLFLNEEEEPLHLSMVLVIDPRLDFFPSLQDIPIPSDTYESLLVRQEDKIIRFVTPLRHLDVPPLSHTLPISSADLPAALGLKGAEGVMSGRDYRQEPVLAVSSRVRGTPWVLIVKMDQKEALAAMDRVTTVAAIGGMLIVLAVGALAMFTRAQSQLSHNEELRRVETAMLAQETRLASVLRAAPIGVGIIRDGCIQEMNEALSRKFSYDRTELLDRDARILFPSREIFDQMMEAGSEHLRQAGNHVFEARLCCKNGQEFDALVNIAAAEEGASITSGNLCFTVTDISEQKHQEKQLEERSSELERSNADLTTFAYVASHDLRSPLRGISQLAEWIRQDMPEDISTEVTDYLNLMGSRIHRMENLLDDLLEYSRVGRVEGDLEEISVEQVCRDCFDLSSPPQAFELRLGEHLPSFVTMSTPFTLVLRNLIGNGVKHHDKDDGWISISVEDWGEDYVFIVADNGPGIPEKYHVRIFALFQTLKPRDEVEGSGMGLAVIRRILETYNGRIQVISDGRTGTVFRVNWPKEDKIRRILDARGIK